MRFRMPAAIVLGALPFSGCERLWNAANQAGLRADMFELLSKGGLAARPMICEMVGTTREGACSFEATVSEVNGIKSALALREIGAPGKERAGLEAFASAHDRPCGKAGLGIGRPSIKVFGVGSRDPKLRLKNGGAFEYLLLYHEPGRSKVCVEVSYSYG